MWNKTFRAIILTAALILAACSGENKGGAGGDGDDDDGGDAGKASVVSIAYLKSLYSGMPRTLTENFVVEGYVSSSDRWGNFYKTVAIEDGTAGIEIKIDMEGIYKTHMVGDRVKVYCNSLTIGAYGGLIQLGSSPSGGYETGYIAQSDISKHFAGTGGKEQQVKPLRLDISALSPAHLSRYVSFVGVHIEEADGAAVWYGGEEDMPRTLSDGRGNSIAIYTSPYAEFAGWAMPQGTLYIEGILSWFDGSYQLRIIDPSAAVQTR